MISGMIALLGFFLFVGLLDLLQHWTTSGVDKKVEMIDGVTYVVSRYWMRERTGFLRFGPKVYFLTQTKCITKENP